MENSDLTTQTEEQIKMEKCRIALENLAKSIKKMNTEFANFTENFRNFMNAIAEQQGYKHLHFN